ncbi:MAG: hypothetical protein D6722_02070 [Bacteroidetes bacterium]|nr:MAG: hypothetical protein D6722_02070 [Bacteroidota bacterium]
MHALVKAFILLICLVYSSLLPGQSLTGQWHSRDAQGTEEWVTLLPNGYFKVRVDNPDDFTEAEDLWGAYTYNGQQLTMQFFNGYQTRLTTRNNNRQSFEVVTEAGVSLYTYQGPAELQTWEKQRLQSEINLYGLTGNWRCGNETLKFTGDGLMFYTDGQNTPILYRIMVEINTLKVISIDEREAVVFQAEISDLQRDRFTLTGADGVSYTYQYQGSPRLAGYEESLHTYYWSMRHRINMGTIDAMDGVRDFLWQRIGSQGELVSEY